MGYFKGTMEELVRPCGKAGCLPANCRKTGSHAARGAQTLSPNISSIVFRITTRWGIERTAND